VQLCILEGLVQEHRNSHRPLAGLRRGKIPDKIPDKIADMMPH
jgi:hypothetical protein